MLAKLERGYFGIGIWHPKTEANVGSLLRTAVSYDAALLATVGRQRYTKQASDTTHAALHTPLLHFATVEALIEHLPMGCQLVGVELDPRAKDLGGFSHPHRAMYLLGAEDYGMPPHVLDECHQLVQIPTVRAFSLNVSVAGGAVMFDRHSKARRLQPA